MTATIRRLLRMFAALCAISAALQAQSRPSFDGTWLLTRAAADTQRVTTTAGDGAFRIGDMGSGWGTTLTFTQRPDRLILEYPYFSDYDLMPPLHYEFALDGREVENEVTIGPSRTRLLARATWAGDTLLVSTRQAVPREVAATGVMAEVRRTLSLAHSDTLLVVTTRVGVAGAVSNVVYTRYVRRRPIQR